MEEITPRNIFIWGTGVRAKELNEMNKCELELLDIVGYIDNDRKKWGDIFYGKKIYSPEILRENGNKNVYIVNQFANEIKEQIAWSFTDCNITIVDEDLISKAQIIMRYEHTDDPEIREVVEHLKAHKLEVFNYPFVNKYKEEELNVEFDINKGLYYTIHCGKKMYFSRSLNSIERIKKYYRSILLEQDEYSPHLYLTEEFSVQKGAVVVDAGVAEGNFSLSIIDEVKKIYMFEPDNDWYEALLHTFEPYMEKVVIINKFLSDYSNLKTTTIDEEISENINFIKMDIEGEELYALHGAEKSIKKATDLKCLICTYHQEFAYDVIKGFFEKNKMETIASKGYMWYPDYSFRAPILRKGLIRAKNNVSKYVRND